jgi:hypothetical protein
VRSNSISIRAAVRLGAFVAARQLGEYGSSEAGFRLASDPNTLHAPDLAVEVLSPTDRDSAIMERLRDYLGAGTRLLWVIDPDARSAALYRANGTFTLVDADGVLDGEDLLPGFRIPLRDILPAGEGKTRWTGCSPSVRRRHRIPASRRPRV